MKRSTWVAVLLTAIVLVAAGNLPRMRWNPAADAVREWLAHASSTRMPLAFETRLHPAAPRSAAIAVAPRLPRFTPPSLLVTPLGHAARPALAPPPVALFAGSLFALLLMSSAAFAWRLRGDRRGRVFQMARRGVSATRIARSARVPQDAVRTLLTPGMGSRR